MEGLEGHLPRVLEMHLDEPPLGQAVAILVAGDAEERSHEELDGRGREQVLEPLRLVDARKAERHECKFEHSVSLLVRASRGFDLVERGLHDACLALRGKRFWDLLGEELEQRGEVDDGLVRKALEQVEEDLLAGPLASAVGQQALKNFAVQAPLVVQGLDITHSCSLR